MSQPAPSGNVEALVRLDSFLPYRLNVLAEAVSQSLSRRYAERYRITVPEWRVLAMLGEHRSLTSAQIARRTRMHKTKVSRAVSDLGAKGIVLRAANRDDMREAILTLSTKGERLYGEIAPMALAFAADLLAALSPSDQAALWRILGKLEERVID